MASTNSLERFLATPTDPTRHPRHAVAHASRSLAYGDLAREIGQVEAAIQDAGFRPGDVVGVVIGDGVDWVPPFIAALRLRAVVLPLDEGDDAECVRLLDAVAPRWVVGRGDVLERATRSSVLRTGEVSPGSRALLFELEGAARRTYDEDVAYLAPTSGSTREPKIVMGSRGGLGHFIEAELDLLGRQPWRVSRLTPPSFDVMLRDLFLPLAAGGTVCLLPRFEDRLNPETLGRWLDEAGVEVVHCVPTILRALGRRLDTWRPSELRWILVAGEPLFASDVRPWLERTSVAVVNVYGTTETTLAKFFHVVGIEDLRMERLPVGRCIPGASAIVLDRSRKPSPRGIVGEVYIRTPYRSHGYLDRPDLTAERLVPNPVGESPEDLVDRTGDLALVRDDGVLEIVGRVDDAVKVRGTRVELGLVEARLRTHPDVVDCALRVLRNEDNDAYLCAYVAGPRGEAAGAELRRWLSDALPAAMVPDVYQLVEMIPRNRRGKVERQALPDPDPGVVPLRKPATETERRVSAIWRSILPSRAIFGVNDDFGLSGGQSIHAAQVVARLESELGVHLSLREFLDLATIGALARRIDEQRGGGVEAPARARGRGDGRFLDAEPPAPLSFAQQRFWRMLLRRPGDASFHYFWLGEVEGELDPDRLAAALNLVVERHRATRTVFGRERRGGGEPRQEALSPESVVLERASVGREALRRTPSAVAEAARSWAVAPFDLTREPPLRVRLFRMDADRHVLALVGHVIVSDGRSKDLLLEELGAFYAGGKDPLEMRPPSFDQFASWERSADAKRVFTERLDYWGDTLPERVARPPLPYDARPVASRGRGEWLHCSLGRPTRERVAVTARRNRSTEIGILLAAFGRALEEWTQCKQVPILLPNPNRLYADEDRVLGCFTETSLLRSGGSGAWPERIARANRDILDTLEYAVPFDWLLEQRYPGVDSYAPELFPVMFAPQPDLSTSLSLTGCRVGEIGGTADLGGAVFPVHVLPLVSDDDLRLSLGFDVRRFTRETAQQLFDLILENLEDVLGDAHGTRAEGDRHAVTPS